MLTNSFCGDSDSADSSNKTISELPHHAFQPYAREGARPEVVRGILAHVNIDVCVANCYEGRYYKQIAPRKGDASPFLNGLGDSETIGAAKRTATKSAHTA
jgi:hypothetical protein